MYIPARAKALPHEGASVLAGLHASCHAVYLVKHDDLSEVDQN